MDEYVVTTAQSYLTRVLAIVVGTCVWVGLRGRGRDSRAAGGGGKGRPARTDGGRAVGGRPGGGEWRPGADRPGVSRDGAGPARGSQDEARLPRGGVGRGMRGWKGGEGPRAPASVRNLGRVLQICLDASNADPASYLLSEARKAAVRGRMFLCFGTCLDGDRSARS